MNSISVYINIYIYIYIIYICYILFVLRGGVGGRVGGYLRWDVFLLMFLLQTFLLHVLLLLELHMSLSKHVLNVATRMRKGSILIHKDV